MSYRGLKAFLIACSGLAALVVATADANAGGLAVREQSAYGQGTSFAGVAAGGSSVVDVLESGDHDAEAGPAESNSSLSGILPYSANTPTAVTGAGTSLAFGGTGNIGHDALVPSSYFSYQFNPKLWIGSVGQCAVRSCRNLSGCVGWP